MSGLLAGGVVDQNGPAGVSGELVNTYLSADGIPVDPNDENSRISMKLSKIAICVLRKL